MAACRSSSENTRKMSLIPVFNKNSPRAHTESEFDVLGRVVTWTFSDGRTIGRWPRGRLWLIRTVASFLKLPGIKMPRPCGRALASARTGSVQAMDAKGLYKGSSNVPFSLPLSPWPREAAVCLVHFVVWAVIRGSFFWSYLSLFCRSSFSLLSLLKTISRSLLLRLQWRRPLLAIGHLGMWIYQTLLRCNA
jgi:hypothetical protein